VRVYQRALIAAMMLVISSSVVAQGLRDRDRTFEASESLAADLRKARLHWGPFYLLSYLQFSDLGYNQSFFFPTNDQTSGFSLAIAAPQRLYFVPSRKVILSAEATPELAFFRAQTGATVNPDGSLQRHSKFNSQFGYALRGDAHLFFNHLYADGYVSGSNHLQALIGEIDRIATEKQLTGGVTGEARYSSRTRMIYAASVSKISYPLSRHQPGDVPVDLLDHTEHNYRLSLHHQTFPLTRLTLNGERSDYSFDNSPQKDGHRTYFGPGFIYDNGQTTLSAEAGPSKVTYRVPLQKEFSGIVGNANYSHQLTPRASLNAAAARDVAISIYQNNNYYIADRLHAGTEFQATRRLTLLAGSTWGRDQYQVPTLGLGVNRRDTFSFTSVGFRYGLRHIRGGLDVGYYDRTSNVDVDQQNGIRVIFNLSLSP